jgi:tetratricopeptide (TPR) repeat protein
LFLLAFYWFLLGLTPVLFLFNGYPWLKMAMMAESWVYLPSIGVFILTAVVINKLKRPGKALFIIIIFLLILCSRYNNTLWRNNISVYQNTLKYLPEDNPVRKNLIYEYLKFGLYDLAFQEIGKFSRSYPDSSERFLLQGDYYYAINVIQEARKNYETALRLNASDAYARKMLEKIEAENAK